MLSAYLDGELTRVIHDAFGVDRAEDLSVKECSDLITDLQRQQRP